MKKTPLYDIHKKLGAQLVDFHGWVMPIQYTSIIQEHLAVRERVGILDLSHMGRIYVSGQDSLRFLQKLLTSNISSLSIGDASYNLILNDKGGIIDDIIIYRMDESKYLLVVNASNTQKDLNWLKTHISGNINIEDKTSSTAIIAIQGPNAAPLLKEASSLSVETVKRWQCRQGYVCGIDSFVLRTSYTGNDGFELIVLPDDASQLWNRLSLEGERFGIIPVGLGARDSLRLEAGLALYGEDMDENTNPLEANLEWAIDFTKMDFIGKDALVILKKSEMKKRLVSFKMLHRSGIPRKGFSIYLNSNRIGQVTSGSYCPTMNKSIGFGYVDAQFAKQGTEVEIDIRGQKYNAVITK